MKQVLFVALCVLCKLVGTTSTVAQPNSYTVGNAHSHNDYFQTRPFQLAYEHGFGSVEADLYYQDGELFVAHDRNEISSDRTFKNLYLDPIVEKCATLQGAIYPNRNKNLQLLIDLKTPTEPTLSKLVEQLAPYENLWYPTGRVQIVISGNTPPPTEFDQYPPYIYFDGRPEMSYTSFQLERIALISQSFTKYSKWKGLGEIPSQDADLLKSIVAQAHRLNKPFRFWASPDTPEAWKLLTQIGANYINTDRIEALASFLTTR